MYQLCAYVVMLLAYRARRTVLATIVAVSGVAVEPFTFAVIALCACLLGGLPQFDLAVWRD